MGKFDGIYLVSDLDGTLLDNKSYSISDENIKAIKYFMSEGGFFGFATGRIVSELESFDALVCTNAPSICYNGMKIYNFRTGEERIIDEHGEDILPFLEYAEKAYSNLMIQIVANDTIYYYRPNFSLNKHKSISNAKFAEISHYSLIPHPWLKIALWDDPDATKHLANTVDKSLLPERYNFMYSFEYCCEISTKKGDKGTALLEAKKLLSGIKAVVAIGDNENDVLMLKNADISFVPSNAVPAAKGVARKILDCDCNHNAVANAIIQLEKML